MKRLRINLHIRDDVSPGLYDALEGLPPRPRAEPPAQARGAWPAAGCPNQPTASPRCVNHRGRYPRGQRPGDRDAFGDELVRVVSGLP